MLCSGLLVLFLALAHAATVPKPISLSPPTSNPPLNRTSTHNTNATSSLPLNDLFSHHIPGTAITLNFRATGDRLPFESIYVCLDNLGFDVIQQIIRHGESAPAKHIFHRHKAVKVSFAPHRMTWMVAREVADALEAIVASDRWTYASHVTVHDAKQGIVGYFSIAYRGLGLPTSMTALASNRNSSPQTSNGSRNRGNTTSITARPRPESPYPYVIPGSHISIVCSDFRRALPVDVVWTILVAAELFVIDRLQVLGPLAPVDRFAPLRQGNVVFEIVAGRRMRWWDLAIALEGLVDFVATFGVFAFSFEVRYEGFRELGVGQLRAEE